jgi:hypothetical protein
VVDFVAAAEGGLAVEEDAAAAAEAAGEGLAAPAVSFLNQDCFAGDGDAAEGEPAAAMAVFLECLCLPGLGKAPGLELDVAVWLNTGEPAAAIAVFLECLCLPGLGEAPGLEPDVAVWLNADETENAANAMRGMIFFMPTIYQQPPRDGNA